MQKASARWIVIVGLFLALSSGEAAHSAPPGGGGGGGGTSIRYNLHVIANALGGTRSLARGMNNYGDVVGEAESSETTLWRPFVYTADTGMVALDSLLAPADQWVRLSAAMDINDNGQIVGHGHPTAEGGPARLPHDVGLRQWRPDWGDDSRPGPVGSGG